MNHSPIVIIGAGLTGLTTAYLLEKDGIPSTIIEARNRPGGRIHTLYQNGRNPVEMGAAWLGTKHTALNHLLSELEIPVFEQFTDSKAFIKAGKSAPPQQIPLPADSEPSYRIKGGSFRLIETLADQLEKSRILYNEPVSSITFDNNTARVKTSSQSIPAERVITTIPPKLLVNRISFNPDLPEILCNTAASTDTWMGDAIKFALRYETPFWREDGSTGTLLGYSQEAPIIEMYDHSGNGDSPTYFALKGFLQEHYHDYSTEQRKELIINELTQVYGDQANDYSSYHETVWRDEPFTFAESEETLIPHQNNGAPVFHTPHMNGRLIIGGSETAPAYPGYMEGAVQSARKIYQIVSEK